MRLKINFSDAGSREVSWFENLSEFPTGVRFGGVNYEWIMYAPDPTGVYSHVLTFGKMKSYDPRWNDCVNFEDEFGYNTNTQCECGAQHTEFPQIHMYYCPKWSKV